MAADGGERIRTLYSLSIIERFLMAVFLPFSFMLSAYVCLSLVLCLYLLKNANEKNQHEQVDE
jgi:hypothetical protein